MSIHFLIWRYLRSAKPRGWWEVSPGQAATGIEPTSLLDRMLECHLHRPLWATCQQFPRNQQNHVQEKLLPFQGYLITLVEDSCLCRKRVIVWILRRSRKFGCGRARVYRRIGAVLWYRATPGGRQGHGHQRRLPAHRGARLTRHHAARPPG